jgi:hypothetical protein
MNNVKVRLAVLTTSAMAILLAGGANFRIK